MVVALGEYSRNLNFTAALVTFMLGGIYRRSSLVSCLVWRHLQPH